MPDGSLDMQINAYLDGEMSDAERAGFEARVATDNALRGRLERWRVIEAGLGASFGLAADAPDPLALHEAETLPMPAQPDGATDGSTGRAAWCRLPMYAAAAALLVASGVVWYVTRPGVPEPRAPRDSYIYSLVTSNFTPAVVCDTPEKFLSYTETTLNAPITADFDSAAALGVTLIGWDAFGAAYTAEGSDELPRVLMALGPGGEKIVVYFVGYTHYAPADDPLNATHVSSECFGDVTAYELSPLPMPVVLGLLHVRD